MEIYFSQFLEAGKSKIKALSGEGLHPLRWGPFSCNHIYGKEQGNLSVMSKGTNTIHEGWASQRAHLHTGDQASAYKLRGTQSAHSWILGKKDPSLLGYGL